QPNAPSDHRALTSVSSLPGLVRDDDYALAAGREVSCVERTAEVGAYAERIEETLGDVPVAYVLRSRGRLENQRVGFGRREVHEAARALSNIEECARCDVVPRGRVPRVELKDGNDTFGVGEGERL